MPNRGRVREWPPKAACFPAGNVVAHPLPVETRMEKRELVIIGGGPAGLTAAIYGKRAGLDVLVLEKVREGGQILITSEIENWPGTPSTTGLQLAENFAHHAHSLGAEIRKGVVTGIAVGQGEHTVFCQGGEIRARALLLATGASFNRLGCEGEEEHIGAGVSFCAVCDGAMFQDEVIAVVGGGNTAVEEACYLTRFASQVHLIHRRDTFRADRLIADRCLANPKIVPVWDTVVEAVKGEGLVEGLTLKNVKTGHVSELPVAGVFVFVGTHPNLDYLDGQLERVKGGWLATNARLETSVAGIFAAGDTRDTPLRQVITAAADGALAAMSAYHHITG